MNDFLYNHLIDVIVLSVLVLSAVWAVLSARLLRAVFGLALASVCVTIVLFRLDSPLAGVFELSVCAGLISAVFLSTVSLSQLETKKSVASHHAERIRRFWYLIPLLLLLGVALSQVNFPEFPVVATVGKDVRLVLWTERHLDLLGQVTILLAGAFGVVVLFKETKRKMNANLLVAYIIAIVLVATSGLYYLLVTTNLIRAVIGLELITKAVTVGLILAGKLSGNTGLAQTLVITLIVVEVVVMVVAVGLILAAFQHTGKVNVRHLRNIKG